MTSSPTDTSATRPSIGMFHELAASGPVVIGRDVAVEQLVAGLGHFADHFDYRLYCPSSQTPTIAESLSSAPNGGPAGASARLSAHDRRTLIRDAQQHPPAAWHENQFDTRRPFEMRSLIQHAYPISIVHHTISYKEMRHTHILPLLLSKPHSYDTLICTSSAARQALTSLVDQVAEQFNAEHGSKLSYRGDYQCIPLPVDVDHFTPREREKARQAFDIPSETFVILWLGRLSIMDKADLLPLIHAYAQLVEQNPNSDLLLLCAGTQRAGEQFGDILRGYTADQGLSDKVRIVINDPNTPSFDKVDLYCAANAFVSPVDNIQESYGITPVEAMACGIPQVVSDWDGYRDTVVDGVTGFHIPSYWSDCQTTVSEMAVLNDSPYDHFALAQSVAIDSDAMYRAFQQLLDNPDLQTRMASASRERAVQLFSWKTVVGQYEQLWLAKQQQAASHPEAIHQGNAYTRPRYRETFGHYASHTLSDETALTISARGLAVLNGETGLPTPYNPRWQYLDLSILQRLLVGLAKMGAQGKSLTIATLISVLTRAQGPSIPAAEVSRHIMWLIKYGLAKWATSPIVLNPAATTSG